MSAILKSHPRTLKSHRSNKKVVLISKSSTSIIKTPRPSKSATDIWKMQSCLKSTTHIFKKCPYLKSLSKILKNGPYKVKKWETDLLKNNDSIFWRREIMITKNEPRSKSCHDLKNHLAKNPLKLTLTTALPYLYSRSDIWLLLHFHKNPYKPQNQAPCHFNLEHFLDLGHLTKTLTSVQTPSQ